MTNEKPIVAIVTVNYNGAAFIRDFAGSLNAITYPNWRLIIVDSASTDSSAESLRDAVPESILIRCRENAGTARGNNVGIAKARELGADYVLILNNDTVLMPGFLDVLVETADARTMAVPKILYHSDPRLISTHAGDFDWRLGLFRNTYHGLPDSPETNRPHDVHTASFCCLLAPTAMFDATGPLDEAFFMYYEETDLLHRAIAAGYRIRYEPRAAIYHRESASSGGGWMTPFKLYYATRNRLYLVKKNSQSPAAFAWFTAYFWATRLPSVLRYALRGRWDLLRALALGMIDYYRGRMGHTRDVADFPRRSAR